MWVKVAVIALAGAVGAVSRFGLGILVTRALGVGFPWGTFVVNAAGCFVFGLLWSAGEHRAIDPNTRMLLLTGFVGAFTTFSTFVFESFELMRAESWKLLTLYLLGSVAVGLLSLIFGLRVARLLA
ncbi:MAG: fluoride efflux transporter CrcB [Myxococcales bacterium]|nr:fluoride efflux transporter CrcB [Myxococcales bacterium]